MTGFFSRLFGGDKRAADRLTEARQKAAQTPGAKVIHVTSIQTSNPKGTAAWVVEDGGLERDSWFASDSRGPGVVRVGETLVVRNSSGYGHYSRRSDVLYVSNQDIFERLPVGTRAAAERYWREHPV